MQPDQLQQTAAPSPIFVIIALVFLVLMIASIWKVFSKAGEPGWAAIVPIYNVIVLLKIAGKPLWWIILFIIPIVSLIVGIFMGIGLAGRFGKTAGYGIGLALLPFIFFPILAFGDAKYSGSQTA